EWVHVQLHQQKGMISLSPPTICNSAFITRDGEALEGEALDDVVVLGIVTFVINRIWKDDDDYPVI
ncbi:hypothetical protein ACTZSX_04210, partial [Klebsiella pneumoniae]